QASRDGYDNAAIADIFSVTERTVQRALSVPEHILRVIDGRVVTMAHAKVLKDAHERTTGGLCQDVLEQLAKEVRERGLTARQLKSRAAKVVGGRRRSSDRLAYVTEDRIRLRRL